MNLIFALMMVVSSQMSLDTDSKPSPSYYTVKYRLALDGMKILSGSKICHRDWKCILIAKTGGIYQLSLKRADKLQVRIVCRDTCSLLSGRRALPLSKEQRLDILDGENDRYQAVVREREIIGSLVLSFE